MGRAGIVLALVALVGAGLRQASAAGKEEEKADLPVLRRTFPLEGVRGPADRTGIAGRLDHMAFDPATKRLFLACVANGSLEAIDLESGARAGSVSGLQEPQGVAVVGDSVYVTSGGDGKLNRFDCRTLAAEGSVAVGDDADNVRVDRSGKLWVSYGGEGPGGLACFDPDTLKPSAKIALPRMPEGFRLHPDGTKVFANLPAGKRSAKDGSVVALKCPDGEPLWERKFAGRAGNFPMTLDAKNDRVFVVTRMPPRLVSLSAQDGTILGEAPCPPQSDDLFFDAQSGCVAVIGGGTLPASGGAGGDGASLDWFTVDKHGRPTRRGGTPLPAHSRTGALVAERRCLYVGVPGAADQPAEVREYRLPD